MNKIIRQSVKAGFLILLAGCQSTATPEREPINVNNSYLSGGSSQLNESDNANELTSRPEGGMSKVESLNRENVAFQSSQLAEMFSNSQQVTVSAKGLAPKDFIHYVYGDLLAANYLLSPDISKVKGNITLRLQENVSQRRLFTLAETALNERGVSIKHDDGVFLFSKVDNKSKASTVVGLGRTTDTIPNTTRDVLQVVPVIYGVKTSLKKTVESLADVKVTLDLKQSALFIKGNYSNVSRALELVQLIDSPANRGRHIGVIKLMYSSPALYLEQISTLLKTEGVPNSINDPQNNNLVFVPLTQIGAVAVFSATEELLARVEFWTKMLDKPSEGDVKQYFVFHPKFARAQDIGESLSPLIAAKNNVQVASVSANASKNSSDAKGNSTGQLRKSSRKVGGSNSELAFVVDQRSNALIFYTTGTEYRNIVPLINRLDVLPKQVMLDIVVAEVTLKDEFRLGVKWALENGRLSGGTLGDVAASNGGFGFTLTNTSGDSVEAAFSQEDGNIKVLSNPSILVRDGVTANLDIGTQISVEQSKTEGLEGDTRITTSQVYRQTGINVSVTPTINAQGVVIMDISETMSNEVTSETTDGNPDIFERKISTAVVAESGQTIILGGLIDEKINESSTHVPLLGDIPLLGNMFKYKTDSVDKTELVLLITPKVISRTDQWGEIMSSFQNKLTDINVSQ